MQIVIALYSISNLSIALFFSLLSLSLVLLFISMCKIIFFLYSINY